MIFFLFVPTESGQPDMVALDAIRLEDAIAEAQEAAVAGRTGYLFDGDRFVREIRTADPLGLTQAAATAGVLQQPGRSVARAPRPG